jgi:hypothetical protein
MAIGAIAASLPEVAHSASPDRPTALHPADDALDQRDGHAPASTNRAYPDTTQSDKIVKLARGYLPARRSTTGAKASR